MSKYAPPSYSRVEVNRAGRRLADSAAPMELDNAIAIIHDWRLAHNKPLNGMYMSIKRRALQMSRSSVIAQRLKRLESIQAKLVRGEVEKLTQIQDIGGCRVVFPT